MKEIYDQWEALRSGLGKRKSKFTTKRKNALKALLEAYPAEDLLLVLKYLKDSEDYYAKYMRGENENERDYTSFDSIFRPTKLKDKIKKATLWDSKRSNYSEETFFPFQIVGS